MKLIYLQCFSLLLPLTLLFTTTLAQSPASAPAPPLALAPAPPLALSPAPPLALAPAPSGPTNVTAVLEKAGKFSILIRLLKSTLVGDRITTLLNTSNQGLTIFAPPDNAFSNLQAGTLNSLTDQQKAELILFHVLPTYVPLSQFQTLSNPVSTEAGNSNRGRLPLNVTTSGNNVSLTTGVVNSTVADTIYTDGQLAVYQVDQVLLPLDLVLPLPPAPAPSKTKKKSPSDFPSSSDGAATDLSTAVRLTRFTHFSTGMAFAVAAIAAIAL